MRNYLHTKDFTNKISRDFVHRWRDIVRTSRQLNTENDYKNRMVVLGVKQLKKALEKNNGKNSKEL